ncbi:MAG: hypothetical protein LBE62_02260 [Azonexus sp.]|nr:hypothetical protein [Azonexus sp.]
MPRPVFTAIIVVGIAVFFLLLWFSLNNPIGALLLFAAVFVLSGVVSLFRLGNSSS